MHQGIFSKFAPAKSLIKKRVVLRGPALTQSGYGVHCRQFAKWLLNKSQIDLSIQPLPWGITPWYIDADALDGLVGKIMACAVPENPPFDISFQVQLPNEWDSKLAKFNVGITAGVETTDCPQEWAACINAMDYVIVPSEHTKKCLEGLKNLINTPIVVIPESFPECYSLSVKPLEVDFAADFNFLLVGQFTGGDKKSDRKNIHNTLRWLCEVFDGDDTTGIVLKANMGRNSKLDREKMIHTIKQAIPDRKNRLPKIHAIHGALTDEEMFGLYCHPKISALVTCTRGEGFGLPILEAAAAGLPVLATNWSGHTDFMSKGKYIKLNHKLVEIPESRVDGKIFVKGTKWAEVIEHDVKLKLEKFRTHSAVPKEWAKALQTIIHNEYSHSAISTILNDHLGSRL